MLSLLAFFASSDRAATLFQLTPPRKAHERPDGIPDEGWAVVMKAGAAARHSSRVRFLMEVMQRVTLPADVEAPILLFCPKGLEWEVQMTEEQAAVSAALLRLEVEGVGGPGGRGGARCGTRRLPILARDCGTRQSGSGESWDAAIKEAVEILDRVLGGESRVSHGLEAELAPADWDSTPPEKRVLKVWPIPAVLVAAHYEFFEAECRRQLWALGDSTPDERPDGYWFEGVRGWSNDLVALTGPGPLAEQLAGELQDGEAAGEAWRRVGEWLLCPDGAVSIAEAGDRSKLWRQKQGPWGLVWVRNGVKAGEGAVPVPPIAEEAPTTETVVEVSTESTQVM